MLEDERLGLEFSGFLMGYLSLVHPAKGNGLNLREGKETLSDRNDILHLPDRVDSVLNGLSVFAASTVEDASDFGNLCFSPVTVGLTDRLEFNLNVRTAVGVQ